MSTLTLSTPGPNIAQTATTFTKNLKELMEDGIYLLYLRI